MKELIFIPNRKNPSNKLHFRQNDKLWEELFCHIAFLAESGNIEQVRFWNIKGVKNDVSISK